MSLPTNERQPRPVHPWMERLFVPWSGTHGEILMPPQLLFHCTVRGFRNTCVEYSAVGNTGLYTGCILI